jgi:hypothetical protein
MELQGEEEFPSTYFYDKGNLLKFKSNILYEEKEIKRTG